METYPQYRAEKYTKSGGREVTSTRPKPAFVSSKQPENSFSPITYYDEKRLGYHENETKRVAVTH